MPNLFEIINEYHDKLAHLQDLDLPPECVLDTMEAIQGDVETKMRAVVAYALQVKADAAARKEQAKRMADSAKAMEARCESLMMYAQVGLMNSGLKLPLVLPEFTLNLAKNPPSLDDGIKVDAVPAQFMRRTCTFTIPVNWDAQEFHVQMSSIGIEDFALDVAVDKKPLLDAVKADAAAHAAYAKLSPTSYRLTVR